MYIRVCIPQTVGQPATGNKAAVWSRVPTTWEIFSRQHFTIATYSLCYPTCCWNNWINSNNVKLSYKFALAGEPSSQVVLSSFIQGGMYDRRSWECTHSRPVFHYVKLAYLGKTYVPVPAWYWTAFFFWTSAEAKRFAAQAEVSVLWCHHHHRPD